MSTRRRIRKFSGNSRRKEDFSEVNYFSKSLYLKSIAHNRLNTDFEVVNDKQQLAIHYDNHIYILYIQNLFSWKICFCVQYLLTDLALLCFRYVVRHGNIR